MEGLKELRASLMNVQNRQIQPRLSDRNIVEIVNKLVERYDLKLVMTLSGKEYLTPGQLTKEIEALLARQGRLNLIELPSVLNVSIEHIETYAQKVSESPGVYFINGQLVSAGYFDELSEEINESLQETGQLLMTDLSLKYSLPVDLLSTQVENRLGSLIQGQFKQKNVLFTDIYVERHRAQLLGALRGADKPLPLKDFDLSLAESQIRDLLANKLVKGAYSSGVFTPHFYQHDLSLQLSNFYRDNMYIEYDYIRKLLGMSATSNVQKIISEHAKGGTHLATCYVHPSLIGRIHEELKEAFVHREKVDMYMDLDMPVCINEEDLEVMLPPGIHLIGTFVFTHGFVENAAGLLEQDMKVIVEETKNRQIKSKKKQVLTIEVARIATVLKKTRYLGEEDELYEPFAELVLPVVSQRIAGMKEKLRPVNEIDSMALTHNLHYISLCTKGLNSIKRVYSNTKPLEVFLMKTHCWTLLHQLIEAQLENQGLSHSEITSNNRAKFIGMLPNYLRSIISALIEKLSQKHLEGFVSELIANSKDLPAVLFKALDKKTEKGLLLKYKQDLKSNLSFNGNYCDVAFYGIKFKLLEVLGVVIELPNELWAVQILRELLACGVGGCPLLEFTTTVLEDMTVKRAGSSERMEQLLTQLEIPLTNI